MGTVYLVRHGQASLGAANYDQLSPLGEQQCEHLGSYWAQRGLSFDAVYTGTLVRHAQSLAAIARGLGRPLAAEIRAGLDEYHPEALVRAIHSGELPRPGTPQANRQHFRLLREGLMAWITAQSQPVGLPSYEGFVAGVRQTLEEALTHHAGRVLIVSSGGPISAAVGSLLQASATALVELNMCIRNSAVTELAARPSSHALLSFNTLPHLDHPERQTLHTFA